MSTLEEQTALKSISRSEFRACFQPSRVILAVLRDRPNDRFNILTVAFNMYASYNPLMYAFAVHNQNYSFELFEGNRDFVIAVPGDNIFREVMFCGTNSGRKIDKFGSTGLTELPSREVSTVGIKECISNLECVQKEYIKVGDHAIVVGEVVNISRDSHNCCKNILSISEAQEPYYRLLARQGVHRLAVCK